MSRRAKISPQDAGLPAGGRRRVAGLRREEVAMLAGVSAEYYVQVERGQVRGVSDEVLQAIADALRLDDVETAHLFDLARAANRPARVRRRPASQRAQVPQGVVRIIETMVGSPAIVQNGRLDIVAANPLGRALYAPVLAMSDPANIARFLFLDPGADQVFPDWEKSANDAVGLLRVEAARSPHSAAVSKLVGELATRSDEFSRRWALHDVRAHLRGSKRFRNPLVGDLVLGFEALRIAGVDDLTLVAYTPEPGSPDSEALGLLASWTASEEHSRQMTTALDRAAGEPSS